MPVSPGGHHWNCIGFHMPLPACFLCSCGCWVCWQDSWLVCRSCPSVQKSAVLISKELHRHSKLASCFCVGMLVELVPKPVSLTVCVCPGVCVCPKVCVCPGVCLSRSVCLPDALYTVRYVRGDFHKPALFVSFLKRCFINLRRDNIPEITYSTQS